MPSVEPRYAEALLAVARNPEESDAIYEVLKAFEKNMDEIPDLHYFMLNPTVPGAAKKGLIKKVLDDNSPVYALNFLCLLVDKGRMDKLKGILQEFRRKKAKLDGEMIIKVTSAEPITPDEISNIAESYKRKYGANRAHVENYVDPSLLGGIKVQVGDLLRDDSLYGRLQGIAAAINCSVLRV